MDITPPVQNHILCYKIVLFAILALFFLQPATATAQGQEADWQPVFGAKEHVLDNGLRVIVIENRRAPVAAQMLWYGVGSMDELQGKSGLAHYLEHLMFKGSGDLGPGEFSRRIRDLGGRDNAFTSWDYTAYFQQLPVSALETAMAMEAERMRGLNPPLDHTLSERDVVVEERKQVLDSNPMARLSEQMRYALYTNHPYGRPIIGWMHEMRELNWDKAKAFYDQYYRPDNAILILMGDFTAQQGFDWAAQYYGGLENPSTPLERKTFSIPETQVVRHLSLTDPTVRQPVWFAKGLVPSLVEDEGTAMALSVLAEWLGGQDGPLYQSFVVEQKLATAISFSYSPLNRGTADWSVGVWPAQGVRPDQLNEALSVFLNGLEMDEETRQRMVTRIQDAAVWERDSLIGPAMTIGHILKAGGTLRHAEYWPYLVEQVTTDQVNQAVQTILVPTQGRVTGWLSGGQE